MGKLEEIREKLVAGSKTSHQLIEQRYAKSSVHYVAKKLKDVQPNTPNSSVPDELQELRHQRDIIKLQKEIAELEAAKENVPDRMAKLEAEVLWLNKEVPNLVGDCYASLYKVILLNQGCDEYEARQEAKSAANDFLKHFGY